MINKEKPHVIGLILIGGSSKRMGYAKKYLPIKNSNSQTHMVELLKNSGINEIFFSCEKNNKNNINSYVNDIYENLGPLVGIYSTLIYLVDKGYENVIIVPIDMPLLKKENINALIHGKQNADACCFYGTPLPLYLDINKKIIEVLEHLLENNMRSLKKFLHTIRTVEIKINNTRELTDMNTPGAWVYINKLLK